MATGAAFPRNFGKYTLLSHLAVGGMADVFLAKQKGPAGFEKECVIKRILPNLGSDEGFVQMFLDEARIAARLTHPNIVHIFDFGQEGGDYFLAMEHIDGLTLEKVLEQVQKKGQMALPWPIAVRIIATIAEALDHAHKVRDASGNPLLLVHRDVSPSNIMISWDGVAKILDFGVAKAMASSKKVKTEVGIIKGKVPYMSPEQLQGVEMDARSDIFSLGAVLYEASCGKRPFPGDSMGQLTVQIMSREPTSPETLNPAFPADLKAIIWRALAKDVEKRYQAARDFKLDLEQFLADQHVSCTSYDVEAYVRELIPDRAEVNPPPISGTERTELRQSNPDLSGSVRGGFDRPVSPSSTTPSAESEAALERARSGPPRDRNASGSGALGPRDSSSGRLGPPGGGDGGRGTGPPEGGSGPGGRLLELSRGLDDLEAEEHQRQSSSSSSGIVTAVIIALVAITAVIFYVLHERAVEKGQTPTPPPPATDTLKPTTPNPGPGPTPVNGTPEKPPTAGTPTPPTPPTAPNAGKPETPKPGETKATFDKPGEKTEKAEKPETPKPEKRKPVHKPEGSVGEDAPRPLPRLPQPPPPDPE